MLTIWGEQWRLNSLGAGLVKVAIPRVYAPKYWLERDVVPPRRWSYNAGTAQSSDSDPNATRPLSLVMTRRHLARGSRNKLRGLGLAVDFTPSTLCWRLRGWLNPWFALERAFDDTVRKGYVS
jgi:hypothetical protein